MALQVQLTGPVTTAPVSPSRLFSQALAFRQPLPANLASKAQVPNGSVTPPTGNPRPSAPVAASARQPASGTAPDKTVADAATEAGVKILLEQYYQKLVASPPTSPAAPGAAAPAKAPVTPAQTPVAASQFPVAPAQTPVASSQAPVTGGGTPAADRIQQPDRQRTPGTDQAIRLPQEARGGGQPISVPQPAPGAGGQPSEVSAGPSQLPAGISGTGQPIQLPTAWPSDPAALIDALVEKGYLTGSPELIAMLKQGVVANPALAEAMAKFAQSGSKIDFSTDPLGNASNGEPMIGLAETKDGGRNVKVSVADMKPETLYHELAHAMNYIKDPTANPALNKKIAPGHDHDEAFQQTLAAFDKHLGPQVVAQAVAGAQHEQLHDIRPA